MSAEEADQGRRDRHAGRRAVLGNGAGRHVDVQVGLAEPRGVERERLGVAAQIAERGLGAFAHRLAEQAGQGQPPLAGHPARLDEEDLAAGRGPGQPGGDAGHAGPIGQLAEEPRRPEQLGDIGRLDRRRRFLALGAAAGDLAADRRDLALEVAQARLAGVVGDDLADRRIRDRQVLGRQAVLLELLGDDVLLGDLGLFLLAVAGKLQAPPAGPEAARESSRACWPWR